MADVDHPKTHVENQKDVELPRKQPESPKHEGIDPLTESDTMYPADGDRVSADETADEYSARSSEVFNAQAKLDADRNANKVGDNTGEGRFSESDEDVDTEGKLPEDAKKANDVGSDRGNTSSSNKPATKDAKKAS